MENMMMEIFSSDFMTNYITEKNFDPWISTPFQGYRHMTNKAKGEYGETFVHEWSVKNDHTVKRAETSTAGYDRWIDDIKTEIKFSLATTDTKKKCVNDDNFVMNHVSQNKDWDRLIFVGVNKNKESYMKWMSKQSFCEIIDKGLYFNRQQGGKSIKNDDWMCSGKQLIELLNSEYMKSMDDW